MAIIIIFPFVGLLKELPSEREGYSAKREKGEGGNISCLSQKGKIYCLHYRLFFTEKKFKTPFFD